MSPQGDVTCFIAVLLIAVNRLRERCLAELPLAL